MRVRKNYAETLDGEQIHYRSVSGERGPAVFFHQTASSGQMYLKTFERIGGKWSCYAFDTPGFGGSFDPPVDSKPPMSQYVDWLFQALQAAGIQRAHLVGHHTGACIAAEMAARYPALAKSVTLVGPVPLTPDERVEFSRHFGAPFTPTLSGSYLLDNWEYLRALGAHGDVMLFNREMADMLRAWWGRVQSYNAVWGQDFTSFFQRLTCPILLMAAPEDVLRPYLDRACEIRPDARRLDIGGANFEPDLDPDSFAAGISAFFAEVER
nr:alpha/beta hydrolase [Sphingomonas sp. Y57]